MSNSRKPNDNDRALGRELADLRNRAGLSQEAVARAFGISTKQYSKYERGESRMAASRYEEIKLFLLRHIGPTGLEESQTAYEAPKPEKETLLRYLRAFERDLKKNQDRLKLCFEMVDRL